jgi:hypothetical protein
MFESFYAKEWVQVTTAFAFLIVILLTPLMYWCIARRLKGKIKERFTEAAREIYSVVLFLLIAPVGYLVLYFLGSKSKFMLGDPMAWICFAGGAMAVYDLIRAKLALKKAKDSFRCNERTEFILMLERLTTVALCLSLIPLLYGIVMIGVTNLMDPASINNALWFLTFMITGLAVIYAVASRSILLVSQAYASNSNLGCQTV